MNLQEKKEIIIFTYLIDINMEMILVLQTKQKG